MPTYSRYVDPPPEKPEVEKKKKSKKEDLGGKAVTRKKFKKVKHAN